MKQTRIKGIYAIICIITMTILSACGRTDNISVSPDSTISVVEEENPFDLEQIENSGAKIEKLYGWGVRNYDRELCEISLDKNELILDLSYNNSGIGFQAGVLVFIDGIAQKYSVNGTEDYLVPVDIEDGSEKGKETKIQIKLTPEYGIDGSEHTLYLGSIEDPEYRVKDAEYSYMQHLQMSVQNTWKLHVNATKGEVSISQDCQRVPFLEGVLDTYIYEDIDGKTKNKLKNEKIDLFEQDGEILENSGIDGNKKVYLYSAGGTVSKYRICCMVNNKPYPAFHGSCYADVTLTDKDMAKVEMDFSREKYEKNSCMYVLFCPYSDNGIPEENFMWDKSENYTLK